MELVIDPHGQVRCLYDEAIDLRALGRPTIVRASVVEPDEDGQWWADVNLAGGPLLGPFARRTEALAAEREWLATNWLPAFAGRSFCKSNLSALDSPGGEPPT